MQDSTNLVSNLITNLGFPIVLVLGLGYAIYKIAILYIKSVVEREKELMSNNKETLQLFQKIVSTLDKVNDKLDIVLEIKEKEKEKK